MCPSFGEGFNKYLMLPIRDSDEHPTASLRSPPLSITGKMNVFIITLPSLLYSATNMTIPASSGTAPLSKSNYTWADVVCLAVLVIYLATRPKIKIVTANPHSWSVYWS